MLLLYRRQLRCRVRTTRQNFVRVPGSCRQECVRVLSADRFERNMKHNMSACLNVLKSLCAYLRVAYLRLHTCVYMSTCVCICTCVCTRMCTCEFISACFSLFKPNFMSDLEIDAFPLSFFQIVYISKKIYQRFDYKWHF